MSPRILSGRLAPTILLACGLLAAPAVLAAQDGPPPGGRAGAGPRFPRPDPVVVNGPPAPGEFRDLVGLDESQATRYGGLYDRYMENTRAERDSLQGMRESMRQAFRGGERPAGPPAGMQDLVQSLEKQQRVFDDTLKEMLGKDQYKKYQDWRSHQRRQPRPGERGRGDRGDRGDRGEGPPDRMGT